jgi:hypothetical protein
MYILQNLLQMSFLLYTTILHFHSHSIIRRRRRILGGQISFDAHLVLDPNFLFIVLPSHSRSFSTSKFIQMKIFMAYHIRKLLQNEYFFKRKISCLNFLINRAAPIFDYWFLFLSVSDHWETTYLYP